MIYNPRVGGYVDKIMYEKALKTQDPTEKGYKGVNPNFGGNKFDPLEESRGSTP